ncbi:hypothetical protein [Luteibacter sp. CQ10]|uniref:hypothetical protein n=1 Tax=Luteibacter sp. CQ10 TaxID=2805821 RepID=UPI0034A1DC85
MDDPPLPDSAAPSQAVPHCCGAPTVACPSTVTCTVAPPTTLFASVSELLKWLADRATPLAALTIAISAFLWGDFRREFGVPVSFASASVLSALPAIFAVVCGVAIVLLSTLLFPSLVLVEPIGKAGRRMVDLFGVLTTPRSATTCWRPGGRWLRVHWWASAILSVLGWGSVVWWNVLHPDDPVWHGIVWMGVLLALEWLCGWGLVAIVGRLGFFSMKGFALLLLVALLMQNYVGFAVLLVVLQATPSAAAADVGLAVVWMFLAMTAIVGAQLFVGHNVFRGWYPNALKHMVCFTFVLLAGIGLVQPMGARLVHFALGSTSTPMRLCTVFVLRDAEKDPVLSKLLATTGGTETVPFNFVFPTDAQYYVRQKGDPKTTWIIDAKVVVATQACPPEPSTDNPEPAKPTKVLFPAP